MSGESTVDSNSADKIADDVRLKFRPGRNAIYGFAISLLLAILGFWIPIAAWLILPILCGLGLFAYLEYSALKTGFDSTNVQLKLPVSIGRDQEFAVAVTLSTDVNTQTFFEMRVGIPDQVSEANQSSPNLGEDRQPNCWIQGRILAAQENTLRLDRSFKIADRGRYEFGPVWLRRSGRFKIVDVQRDCDVRASIDVLPETFWTAQQLNVDDASEQQLLDRIARTRNQGTGTEFESLSEFRNGDDPQRIDWRASARSQHLIVRRYQVERHRDLMVIVDCGRLMASDTQHGSKLDCAVDAALMLSRVAIRAGDRCGMATYDNQVLSFVPPLSGAGALPALVREVYDLKTAYRESDFGAMFETLQVRHRKRSLVVVLSDIAHDETTTRFRSSLMALAKRHVVLFAAIRTPLLSKLPHEDVTDLTSASRQIVAFRLQQERERAVNSLRSSAVSVLDVEPSDLTVPLINRFIDLRVQNRL